MAEKILDAEQLEQLKCEIAEATSLVKTVVDLTPCDEATATTHAMEELARKAGWLLDRCTHRLGSVGCMGPQYLDWCGGAPEREQKRIAGRHNA